ncbi:MAG: methyl-accepting chemotaxis protein [Gallionellaceae bacterium]|nr:methyl-accepting chemotaxis protein [Gallionellaceae bacterium]
MENTANPTSGLHRVVKTNEEIKKVIRISSGVNLVAINAMLVAKRSGERSRGFAVVSSELRIFSRNLESAMTGLGTLIFELVRDAAAMQKQQQERAHFLHIGAQGKPLCDQVAPALARVDGRIRETGDEIGKDWHKLRLQLNRVLQLCEAGGSLSRSAKIEAVYGGDMSTTLKQVANQIEDTVNEIFSTLKLLRTQLAE